MADERNDPIGKACDNCGRVACELAGGWRSEAAYVACLAATAQRAERLAVALLDAKVGRCCGQDMCHRPDPDLDVDAHNAAIDAALAAAPPILRRRNAEPDYEALRNLVLAWRMRNNSRELDVVSVVRAWLGLV